jgi:hypothetical protein
LAAHVSSIFHDLGYDHRRASTEAPRARDY